MANKSQLWLIRIGVSFGGLLLSAILGLTISSVVSARADTTRHAAHKPAPQLMADRGIGLQDAEPAAPAPEPRAAQTDSALTLRRVLVVDGPFRHGDYIWDDAGVPPGEVVITVDIKAQTIAVFRGGYQIGAAVSLYGADHYPTPLGTFPIMQKKVHHISNLYDAPMPYMMRLTNDGVAIHASDVKWGNATHGCIGVPLEFAKLVFAQARVGTRVIITSGKMMAVPRNVELSQAGMHD